MMYRGFRLGTPFVRDRMVDVPVYKYDEYGDWVLDVQDVPIVESSELQRRVALLLKSRAHASDAIDRFGLRFVLGSYLPIVPEAYDDDLAGVLCESIPRLIVQLQNEIDRRWNE